MKTAGVVQRLSAYADEFADWLSKAGYRVLACSGPVPPTFRCWAQTGEDSPLLQQADRMIDDPWLPTGPRHDNLGSLFDTERALHPGMPMLILANGRAARRDVAVLERPGAVEMLPLEITANDLVTAVECFIGRSEVTTPVPAQGTAANLPLLD